MHYIYFLTDVVKNISRKKLNMYLKFALLPLDAFVLSIKFCLKTKKQQQYARYCGIH